MSQLDGYRDASLSLNIGFVAGDGLRLSPGIQPLQAPPEVQVKQRAPETKRLANIVPVKSLGPGSPDHRDLGRPAGNGAGARHNLPC